MEDALNPQSNRENHMDGSCEQKGGARKATDVAVGGVMMEDGALE